MTPRVVCLFVIFVLMLGACSAGVETTSAVTESTVVAADARGWNTYSEDPEHIWNRVYRNFFSRTYQGTDYGLGQLDPLLWPETAHLLEGDAYLQSIALLDEFLGADAGNLIAEPLQRAVFQRDLWAVFDWLGEGEGFPDRRIGLRRRLTAVMRSVALTREEILKLPDNYEDAVASGMFPSVYFDSRSENAFLPGGLFDPRSGWIMVGRDGGPMAFSHTFFPFSARSTFLVFLRMPGGRQASLDFIQEFNHDPNAVLPEGTEFALARFALLIDETGDLVQSPLLESLQVRHIDFADVRGGFFELKLDRARLFAGVGGGLKVSPSEISLFFSHGDPFGLDREQFEVQIPEVCAGCHLGRGLIEGVNSFTRGRLQDVPGGAFSLPDGSLPVIRETTLPDEGQKVIEYKMQMEGWEALMELWSR